MYRRSVSVSVLFVILLLGSVLLGQGLPAVASSPPAGAPSLTLPALGPSSAVRAASSEEEGESLSTPCNVGGFIASDTTWSPATCDPYIVTASLVVMEGVTLAIEPGVTVKFDSLKALTVQGTLVARGTEANPITFTSNQATPAKGDWGYIHFADSSTDATFDGDGNYTGGSIIQYAVIEYAGGASVSENGALRIEASSPFIDHNSIQNNKTDGIHAWNNAAPRVTYNTVRDNGISDSPPACGICADQSGLVSYNTVSNNTGTGIYVDHGNTTTVVDSNSVTNNDDGVVVFHQRDTAGAAIVSNNTIDGNSSMGVVVGQYEWAFDGSTTIDNNSITNNALVGVVVTDNTGTVTISRNTITGNLDSGVIHWGPGDVTINSNTVTNNNSSLGGGGIWVSWDNSSTRSFAITNNTISNNSASDYGGGIYLAYRNTGTISDNIITGNTANTSGGGIRLDHSTVTISDNTIFDNVSGGGSGGIAVLYNSTAAISGNTITNNEASQANAGGGISISNDSSAVINDNDLYGNTADNAGNDLTNHRVSGTADVNAENNYWGTTDTSVIEAHVWHFMDDSSLGIVDYIPYRTEHNTAAPISPPTGLAATPSVSTIDLSWNPNPESDLAGYKVYYDTDRTGFPYDGTGASEGNSPIDVGNVNSFALTGLAPGTRYYIAITAYDTDADGTDDQTDGNESWYSVEVSATPGGSLPTLSIDNVTVVEGDAGTTNAVFTVGLSGASGQQVTVDYATADDTATAGEDYVTTSGTLAFPAGTTTQNVTVVVNGDTLDEPDESFLVNLSNPTNATIADGQGVGTIEDDDPPPSLSIDDVTIVEGDTGTVSAVFTVTLSAVSGQQVMADYATADGTATAGNDYVATSGTLTFPPGSTTQNATVTVNGDTLDEPDETLFVNLSNPTNATIADGQGVGTITDDDPPPTPGGPDITVTPTSVTVTLPESQSTTVPLTIANVGDVALAFSIARQTGTAAAQNHQPPSFPAQAVGRDGISPHSRVDPELLDVLDAAPDGRVTFFVYLEEQADLSYAYAIHDWKARGEFVYRTLRETAQRSQKGLLADLRRQQSSGAITEYRPFFILNAVAVTGGRSAVDALAARPDVAYLAPEPVYTIPDPIDEHEVSATPAGVEWNVAQIRADRAWADFGITGTGVVVANIDTGVDASHPALVNQYRGTATGSHDYNWYDPTGHYPTAPGDNHGHGTHVMGTMVGDDGAGNQIGVAPGAQWIAAKGCAGRGCTGTDLLDAAEWILAPCPIGVAPGDPACDAAKRPQVVNNSWGGAGGDPWFESAVSAWRASGIFPAFAAGNSGPGDGTVGSPGDYATSFASGATDQADTICWFSSRGPSRLTPETKPDVAAPGCKGIRSALPGGGYGTKNGTSMASPHVAGVVALLLQANPDLNLEEIEALLTSTAVDLGPQGPDKIYGHGRLDAYAAVAQAGDPVPWLGVDPTSGAVNPGNQTEVTLTLDAAGLSTGAHTASLIITSNDPDEPAVTVPVTLTVTSGSPVISHVRVSNLRDVSAGVSWITTVDADGRVYYGTDPASLTNVAHDDRGAGIEDDVHHVTIGGLNPNTIYYFYVVSGETADDNEGQYYSFTTGAPLSIRSPDNVYGQVFKSDGVTPAADVLVYLRGLDNDGSGSPGQSGLLSGLTDSNGYWIDSKTGGAVNLAAVRAEDGQSYFVYSESGDAVRIEIQGAADCEGLMQVDTGDDSPAPDIILSCLNMINLDITPGWSVFVWPAVPAEAYDASDLLGAIQDAGGDVPEISQWLAELGNWSGHLRGLPFGDFEVGPGEPYFLRSTRRSLLRVEAGVGIAQSEVITLTTGWNFAALARTAGVMTAEAACEQIVAQGGAVGEINRWDANVGNWAGHICGLPFGDFEMMPEEGYFVKSGADSTWRPSGGAGVQGSTGAGEKGKKGKREKGNTATRDPLFPYSLTPLSTFPIVGEVGIRNVRVTNVTDRSFTVMWETDRAVPGWVRFATIRNPKPVLSPVEVSEIRNWMVAYDDRGAGVTARTHHVTVAGLSPGTTYSFAVASGATTDDNGGQLYQVATGPTLGIPAVRTVYGRVLQGDGVTPAAGALVILALEDADGEGSPGRSASLSAVTDAQGYWSVNLGAARTPAGDAYFATSTGGEDRLTVTAWHPALEQATWSVQLGDLPAVLPLELRVAWPAYPRSR